MAARDAEEFYDDDQYEEGDGFASRASGFRGREDEKAYDKDPEFAEILGSCLDDPQKAQSKVSSSFVRIVDFFFRSFGCGVINCGEFGRVSHSCRY